MSHSRLFDALLVALLLVASGVIYAADMSKFVQQYKTVAQTKAALRATFEAMDNCGFGSCVNGNSMLICEIVAALDVNMNGIIIREMWSEGTKVTLPARDLRMLKLLFAQCKPTNYQYWNYDTMLHVGYRPSHAADVSIRRYLGVTTEP
jgi:hypothetical protein